MKHFVSTIVLMLICITCNAQINRTIWGCTLGKSTRQQVKNAIINRGYSIDSESATVIKIYGGNIKFGGINWLMCEMCFVNGVFSSFSFITDDLPYSDIYLDYENIGLSLYEKYGAYFLMPSKDPNDKSTIKLNDYSDDNIYIRLKMGRGVYYSKYYYLYLCYKDINLFRIETQNNQDEL